MTVHLLSCCVEYEPIAVHQHRKMTLQKRCSAGFRISIRYGQKTDINKTDTACALISSVLLSHPITACLFVKWKREAFRLHPNESEDIYSVAIVIEWCLLQRFIDIGSDTSML